MTQETATTPRQDEILEHTFELVREFGLANLTMKKVAERMGFTEPALYRHFPNKQALILGLLDRLSGMLLPPIREAAADQGSKPVERLERILAHHLGMILKTDGLPFLILAEAAAAGDDVVIGRMKKIMAELRDSTFKVLSEMPSSPGDPPPQALAMPLFGFAVITALQRRLMPEISIPEEQAMAMIPLLVRRITGWKEEDQ